MPRAGAPPPPPPPHFYPVHDHWEYERRHDEDWREAEREYWKHVRERERWRR